MENTTKALLIAGGIIICVLLVSVGIFVYSNSENKVISAVSSMSTTEKEAYNSKYMLYDGNQTGSDIKQLIGKLIANSNSNKDNLAKIPGVFLEDESSSYDSGLPDSSDLSNYTKELENIRSHVEAKHKYWVEISFQTNGLIDYFTISYDENNIIEPMNRN